MLRLETNGKIRVFALSPCGARVAYAAGRAPRATIWKLANGEKRESPAAKARVQVLAFAPRRDVLLLSAGRALRQWHLDLKLPDAHWARLANECRLVSYSRDGTKLVALTFPWSTGAGVRYYLTLFDVANPQDSEKVPGDYGPAFALAFSPSGRWIAAGGEQKMIRVWTVGEKLKSKSWLCSGKVNALAFSPCETQLAVAAKDWLALNACETWEPRAELVGHAGAVSATCFLPNGTLLSAGADGTARLWDTGTARELACFDWKLGALSHAAVSADGALAAVAGERGIVVWDLE
jgi:WD40 repeat protein